MEIVIGIVGLCGIAVVTLILWDRLGRLEFEVKRLKSIVQMSQASAVGMSPDESTVTVATPEKLPANKTALPLDTSSGTVSGPVAPTEGSLPPEQLPDDPPLPVAAREAVGQESGPAVGLPKETIEPTPATPAHDKSG